MARRRDYVVTVCASCLCASCWQGEFYCQRSKTAKTIEMRASGLRELKRESPYWFSIGRIVEVTGSALRSIV